MTRGQGFPHRAFPFTAESDVSWSYHEDDAVEQRADRPAFGHAKKLGLVAGATLDVLLEAGRIVLTPAGDRPRQPRLGTDRATGLPILAAERRDPPLTSSQVKALLADFP